MLEIGLTGGIGSGKSTVAGLLVDRGATLLDADAIVRELQQPGTPVFAAMVARWGDEVVADDGTLDRGAVAARAFTDPDELVALNAIVHPAVGEEMTRRRRDLATPADTVILDIPLLVESGHEGLGGDLVVDNGGSLDDLAHEVDRAWVWIATLDRPPPGHEVHRIGSRTERN